MSDPILSKSREVRHCPPHFIKVPISKKHESSFGARMSELDDAYEQRIRDWMHETVENRFFLGKCATTEGSFVVETNVAAFEVASDATYFTLLLPSFSK